MAELLWFVTLLILLIVILLSGATYGILYYKSDKKLKLSDSLSYVKEGALVISPLHDNGVGNGGNRTPVIT
uniref:P8 n=1 Tax=Olivavirus actinidiae TaxID=2024724 RepID=A0A7L9CER5_9CLOS|nr:p8 [Actinidia virus 1]QOJ38504.1 P8 [Actinidia virus 1]